MTHSTTQHRGGRKLLGEMLVDAGLIDEIQLTVALGAQSESGLKLGKQLLKLGFVEERDLAMFLKDDNDLGIPLPKRNISREALASVPEELAFRHKVIPLAVVGKTLVLATSDPRDLKSLDELSFVLGKKIQAVRAFEWEIETALLKFYKHFSDAELDMLTNVSSAGEQYQTATWAFDSEVLLQDPSETRQPAAKPPPQPARAPQQTNTAPPARTIPRPAAPPAQPPTGRQQGQAPTQRLRPAGLQPPPQTAAPAAPSARPPKPAPEGEGFILEHTSLTAGEARPASSSASPKSISDIAINLKNADIIQTIIDLLVEKGMITEKELMDRLISLHREGKR